MRVVIVHQRAVRLKLADDLQGRGLAQVVDVGLVGHAQHQHPRSGQALALRVERVVHLLHAEVGHVLVDLAGEFDELGPEVELARLPGEVEGVDGDAVAAQARARLEAP